MTGEERLGTTTLVLIVAGLALATRPGRALFTWIGEGVVTGLCLTAGFGFSAIGVLMLLPYVHVLAQGLQISLSAVAIPLVFLACGIALLVRGVRRLFRLRGLPRWRG